MVFLSMYEFFIDVSYLLGDGERFPGFDASLMDTDYAVRNTAKTTRWRMDVVSCFLACPSFRRKEELSGLITASGEALDVMNYFR